MTHEEYEEGIERAEGWFRQLPGVSEEMVEALIEEGFLSYDDLTFLEPAQLGELIGLTEDQAEEVIAFAEEAAERVEEETRLAKAEGGRAAGAVPAGARSAAQRAAELLPLAAGEEDTAMPAAESKQTFQSLFRDEPAKPEENLSAAQVFGETPPAGAGEQAQPEEKE
jgi:N utilization substance protein A